MTSKRVSKRSKDKGAKDKGAKKDKKQKSTVSAPEYRGELVILTGLSGSGSGVSGRAGYFDRAFGIREAIRAEGV